MGDWVKSLAKAWVNDILCSSVLCRTSDFIRRGVSLPPTWRVSLLHDWQTMNVTSSVDGQNSWTVTDHPIMPEAWGCQQPADLTWQCPTGMPYLLGHGRRAWMSLRQGALKILDTTWVWWQNPWYWDCAFFQNWVLEENLQSVKLQTVLSMETSMAALKQRTAGKCLRELRSI